MQARRPITRTRELVACSECRRRKLKCDHGHPCTACSRRGDSGSCKYQRFLDDKTDERRRRIRAESRLEHLEQLVKQLAESNQGLSSRGHSLPNVDSQSGRDGTVPTPSSQPGTDDVSYNGSTHWSAMLEDINELRVDVLDKKEDDFTENDPGRGLEGISIPLILGAESSSSLEQILDAYMPSRQEADRLVAVYFRARTVAAPFIHTSSFKRLYAGFWSDPNHTSPLWISIFFSICHVAKNVPNLGQEGACFDNKYSAASAHCLAIGEFFRPRKFAVEALLLYCHSLLLTSLDVPHDVGTIFGLLIRLASRMGYHRDPSNFRLSPFEAEIRRRTWSMCLQLDMLISFQLGLPSNIQYPTWDTHPPRNLLDSDFDETTVELPPARPDAELTPITFYITKHKFMAIFEKVLRQSLSIPAHSLGSPNSLDAEVRSVYDSIPEILRPRPMTESSLEESTMIVTRLCVALMYNKCLCVLHRPHAIQGRVESIKVCHQAASNLVRYFLDIYKEFQPGGQAESERWFMSSITWHDYLLGVAALCLVCCAVDGSSTIPCIDLAQTLGLIKEARVPCAEQAIKSRDTARVRRVVDATLSRLETASISEDVKGPPPWESTSDVLRSLPSDSNGTSGSVGMTGDDWAWNQDMVVPMDDASWTYLEQFLNLPYPDDSAMDEVF